MKILIIKPKHPDLRDREVRGKFDNGRLIWGRCVLKWGNNGQVKHIPKLIMNSTYQNWNLGRIGSKYSFSVKTKRNNFA